MPYVPISYIGWPEDWFDNNGEPRVNEPIIKYFVNRYFAFPDDRDDEGPLIRIWVKCKTCAFVKEHVIRIRETEVEWEHYQYNGDNTFTFLPEPYCNACNQSKERNEAIKNLHTIKSAWNDPSTLLSPITLWDNENNNGDMSLIMIWVRCITCGSVTEHFMTETEEDWEYFLSNRDNTYTLLSESECNECLSPHTSYTSIPMLREERSDMVEEEYRSMFPEEINMHLGSAIEEYFWKAWRTTFSDFSLIPQYQIGNYYVDFAHIPTKTVIELDGKPYHTTPHQKAKDEVRQKNIERQGWCFLRFDGKDIYYHVDRCIIETLWFLSKIRGDLVYDAQYQWWSSPSARLLTRLKKRMIN